MTIDQLINLLVTITLIEMMAAIGLGVSFVDLAGVAVSSGSACSSGKVEASHVLSAMGVAPELAQGAIRISLGFATSNTDIQAFLRAFGELINRLKQSRKVAA